MQKKLFSFPPLLFLLLLFSFTYLPAQFSWTPEDIIHTDYVSAPHFSPDGSMAVWSKKKAVKEKDKFVNDLYLTYFDIEEKGKALTVQLTQGEDNNGDAIFSRDGRHIYFTSSRDKGKKLWRLSRYGGEAEEVHEFKNNFGSLQWLNDSTLTGLSDEGPTRMEREWKEEKDDTEIIEDTLYWRRKQVYSFDLKEKEWKPLTNFDFPVSSYQLSHDGKWLFTTLEMSPHYDSDAQPKARYYLHKLEEGSKRQILQDLQTPGGLEFTADDKGFYFSATTSSDPKWAGAGIEELYHYDLATNRYLKVDLGAEWGIGGGYSVIGSDILVSLANGPTNKLAFYQKQEGSWNKQELALGEMDLHVDIQAISEDGKKVLFSHSTASQLPLYYHAKIQKEGSGLRFEEKKEWISLNDKLKKKTLAKSEIFRWTGALNEEVNGILYYPKDYEPGKRYPLLLSIHGGPSGVDRDAWSERWSTYPNLWSERGAFVLKPNYHGSSNHGQAFVESIKGHYYDLEMVDIMNGIRALAARGLIDTTQMGTMGWSNGAILSTMLTVRYPNTFKVATPGAGDVNWTSDFGTCSFGVQFDQSYFGGAPWDDVDGKFYNPAYIEKSPLFELEKVTTPTLIFHGSADRAVPRDQGWEYYRALQQVGKAPVRFLWFPDQPHGLGKISHQLRKMEEEIAWVEKYLWGKDTEENPAFDEKSQLALLLKKEKMARSAGKIGIIYKGKYIPQVVSVKEDSISIGTFELTNAQYFEFNRRHVLNSSTANKPVTGLSMEEIQAYLKALSKHTGDSYRLPTAEEAKALHKAAQKAADKENTLPYWAGYAPTSRELALLQQKLAELRTDLFLEVGQFAPVKVGEAELYDLGGNAAEYAADGSSYGFSAYEVADATQKEVDKARMGFRVVKE